MRAIAYSIIGANKSVSTVREVENNNHLELKCESFLIVICYFIAYIKLFKKLRAFLLIIY